MITNKGKVLWANALGNLRNGFNGTVKESTSTTLTSEGGPKWTAEQFTGQDVYAGGFVGTILKTEETKLTVARWEKLPTAAGPTLNRSEVAPEAPKAASSFYIVSGATPAAWVALTANSAEPKATSETLSGEINKSEGGLNRSLSTFKYIGTNEYEVKLTFVSNSHDALPVTVAKIGIFNAQNGGILMFETLLTATAEVQVAGDSVTVTDIVSGS
jgi:hypothetical protein